jgi:osmotically inducible lipoprotein OsmB
MYKIAVIGIAALALAGCQSTGPNQMVGTGVGAVGGYGVARALGAGPRGSAIGAVAGALVGSEVGRSMDGQPQPYYRAQPAYAAPVPLPPRRQCYQVWDRTPYGPRERTVCEFRRY